MTGLHTLGILSTSFISSNRCALLIVNLWISFPSKCASAKSVVLWQGSGGLQKIALFDKRTWPWYGKNSSKSKEKWQSIITLGHEGQSIHIISRTLKVSSSAVAKTIKRYDETGSHRPTTGKEDPELPMLQRVSSFELPASEIAAQINASEFM